MTAGPLPRRRLHRAVFLAAGIYNLAWGTYAALDPPWLFRLAGMPPANHPQIFACLGMVLGLYGVLYLEVGRVPEGGQHGVVAAIIRRELGVMTLAAWVVVVLLLRAAQTAG